ncbi:MAG TPA: S8 family peptidase [Flavobacterium sp.]|nr:S8 family peptidase [Flavobacterium sp.]
MKRFFIIFCCLCFSWSQGQTVYKYYMYLDSSSSAPVFTKSGAYSVYVGTNPALQTFFSNYSIISFSKAIPSSDLEIFSKVLVLETESSTLANALVTNYPATYLHYDDITNDHIELTSTYPNDYGTTSPNPNLGAAVIRKDLDYINASKAWDVTDGSGSVFGLSDARIKADDPDFAGIVTFAGTGSYQNVNYSPGNDTSFHGTYVGGIAAALGNNAYGSTGICYKCHIVAASFSGGTDAHGIHVSGYDNLMALYNAGATVINMSWANTVQNYSDGYRDVEQGVIHFLEAHGVVLVASAGNYSSYQTIADNFCNGFRGTVFSFPACYDGVISVSDHALQYPLVLPLVQDNTTHPDFCCISPTGIPCFGAYEGQVGGTADGTDPNHPVGVLVNGWPDACSHGLVPRHTTNPLVDIMAPSYQFNFARFAEVGIIESTNAATSAAAPHVSGTASLMQAANRCITPAEVDAVLKLTSKDIEQLSFNQIYAGNIGAGALNTGDAVVFVDEMKKTTGTAVIQNHIFYRFNFDLQNIHNNLNLQDVTFSDDNVSDFRAKNQIRLLPGTILRPNTTGRMHLSTDLAMNTTCSSGARHSNSNNQDSSKNEAKSKVFLFPNPNTGTFEILLNDIPYLQNQNIKINVIDINGRIIHEETFKTDNNSNFQIPLNINSISNGIYFVKLSTSNYSETLKFIKK